MRVLGLCAAKNGTGIDESMQAGEHGYERVWENGKTNLNSSKHCQQFERMEN